jgi:hypothetical protein
VEEILERCLGLDAYGLGKITASPKASLNKIFLHAVAGCNLDDLFVESLEVASKRFALFLDNGFKGRHRFWMATRSCELPGEHLT